MKTATLLLVLPIRNLAHLRTCSPVEDVIRVSWHILSSSISQGSARPTHESLMTASAWIDFQSSDDPQRDAVKTRK
ncbi:hypothetical protein BDR07DRAFT_1398528 [Suillus spraguei]|nr:hypothetical protein BDR07DRAFT_1398528 [Suillus spraguei]